jgi:hypothetical protein
VYYSSKLVDGATPAVEINDVFFWTFAPLFWTFGDMFAPLAVRWAYVPGELHVKLYPVGEAPGRGR